MIGVKCLRFPSAPVAQSHRYWMPYPHGFAAMRKLIKALLVMIVAASASSTFAQTQVELNEQAGHALTLANHDLDAAIQTYRKRLHWTQRLLFDKSQAAWDSYRRAACSFESSGVSGGSVQPMVMSGCLEAHAKERLRYIETLSTCEKGNLNCPAWNKGI
jgi:uncharacterized protein YecT (DUF1311 family)